MMSDTQCNLPQKLIGPHKPQKNLIVSYQLHTGMYLHIPPYKCAYLFDWSYIYNVQYFADIACVFAHVCTIVHTICMYAMMCNKTTYTK